MRVSECMGFSQQLRLRMAMVWRLWRLVVKASVRRWLDANAFP
jgi:hypothetical protein